MKPLADFSALASKLLENSPKKWFLVSHVSKTTAWIGLVVTRRKAAYSGSIG
ncbi:MAG: hypothetical protein ACJ8G2_07520 [Burkholderiales bacterium]